MGTGRPSQPWSEIEFGALAPSPRIDPQLAAALASDFADYRREGEAALTQVTLVVELQESDGIVQLRGHVEGEGRIRGDGPGVDATLYSVDISVECCRRWAANAGREFDAIKRLELALPVIPGRPRPRPPRSAVPRARPRTPVLNAPAQTSRVLIGVIDHGCAFAHQSLRRGSGTRVLRLWDQDPNPAFGQAPALGRVPASLGYGRELLREELEALMLQSRTGGVIDEAECYAAAGYAALAGRAAHGAAVLDLLAGPLPLGARLASSADEPPSWQPSADAASEADIVFVQIPRDAVQDSSSASLAAYVLDGLRYICDCADKQAARAIVVNISDGSSRGPHDGTSLVERAMAERVQSHQARSQLEPGNAHTLHIVVAAGNNALERRHAQVEPGVGPAQTVCLRLPPDSEMPAFIQVSLPPGASTASIEVVEPARSLASGEVFPGRGREWRLGGGVVCSIVHASAAAGARGLALISIAPTLCHRADGVQAPSGDWLLRVRTREPLHDAVHFYISRNDTNIGALPRAHQARFVDAGYDAESYLRNAEDDPKHPTSPIRRASTLSGLAGARAEGVEVAGGVRLFDGQAVEYASKGPALRNGHSRELPRQRSDADEIADVSRWLPGVYSGGTRSGVRVRMLGTSFAVPQLARKRAGR